jgi:hypothetical protein
VNSALPATGTGERVFGFFRDLLSGDSFVARLIKLSHTPAFLSSNVRRDAKTGRTGNGVDLLNRIRRLWRKDVESHLETIAGSGRALTECRSE